MKNKFITFIILLILCVIWAGLYHAYVFTKADRGSFVILIEGEAFLNDQVLELEKREALNIWDIISTKWENSLAVIEWWDGSLTRIGWNSSIELNELFITHDISKMNISFTLLSWKSWSNVISFLWDDSYFKEYFMDSEASVRGTVFDVDLENGYIYVLDHEVRLTTENKGTVIIWERDPFSLKTFSFISLEKFIREIKDNAWETLNKSFDTEYIKILKNEAYKALEDNILLQKFDGIVNSEDFEKVLWSMSEDKKSELYNNLLTEYQKINFVNSDDWELFITKIKLKEALVATATVENKKALIQSTLFDFKELIQSKNFQNLEAILPILQKNSDILKELNIEFLDYFNFDIIPEDLKIFQLKIWNEHLKLLKIIRIQSYIEH